MPGREPAPSSLGLAPDRHVPVILAERPHLVGAHALEGLGLAVDPLRRVLELTRFPLA
jgi:hypothetical protein